MKKSTGYIYAILAAICNGLIGIFSVKIMKIGMHPYAVSFYKCLFALIIISSFLILSGQLQNWWRHFKQNWKKLAICAFFGFLMLYFFETNAYNYADVPVVVFLLLGSATITTFILSSIIKRRLMNRSEMFSYLFAIIGLAFVIGITGSGYQNASSNLGVLYAVIAGIGYGLFVSDPRTTSFKD
jgi:drug/metabolite transporter (DMT)-like permease